MVQICKFSQLCSREESKRDQNWEGEFFKAIEAAHFVLISDQAQQGPDGWPYIFVKSIESDSAESFINLLQWLTEKGIGLAINPDKKYPDYVFTYGMLWNYRQKKEFLSEKQIQKKGEEKLAGAPTEEYFPHYVQKIVRQFFKDQKIDEPKFLVVSNDEGSFDLCLSLESIRNPDPSEHKGILEALSWFFPSHYNLALGSEKSMPPFVSLTP